jgi:hypothetical protein
MVHDLENKNSIEFVRRDNLLVQRMMNSDQILQRIGVEIRPSCNATYLTAHEPLITLVIDSNILHVLQNIYVQFGGIERRFDPMRTICLAVHPIHSNPNNPKSNKKILI